MKDTIFENYYLNEIVGYIINNAICDLHCNVSFLIKGSDLIEFNNSISEFDNDNDMPFKNEFNIEINRFYSDIGVNKTYILSIDNYCAKRIINIESAYGEYQDEHDVLKSIDSDMLIINDLINKEIISHYLSDIDYKEYYPIPSTTNIIKLFSKIKEKSVNDIWEVDYNE